MDSKGFAFIGGDMRQVEMAKRMANEGYNVFVYGYDEIELNKFVKKTNSIKEAINEAKYIILPLPCSVNGETINAPLYKNKIIARDIFKELDNRHIVFAGKINSIIKKTAQEYDVNIVDYFEREELIVSNTIPTAEGAIQLAMEEMPITLHGSRSLVLGFGRVGKTLSKLLNSLGSEVTVEARKHVDLAWIKNYGYKPLHINSLEKVIMNFDVIFNTIPHVVLDEELIKKIRKDCLVIDLASKPGGVDFNTAKKQGINVIWALSLPGKVAPITAGNIIIDTIINIIEEMEGEEWSSKV